MTKLSSSRTQHSRGLFGSLVVTSVKVLVLGCALLSLSRYAQAQQQVAYVFAIEGNWSLNGSRTALIRGKDLPGGGTITPLSASTYDFITIADLNGKIITSRHCSVRGDCDRPIKLPPPPGRPGLVSSAFGAVMSLIWGEPDRYSVHRTRSGEIADAVVKLNGDQINLSPIFNKSDKGTYYLRLAPLSAVDQRLDRKARSAPGPSRMKAIQASLVTLEWDPNHPMPVSVPKLKPGLYELTMLELQNGRFSPTDLTSWILISSPNTYEKSVASYQKAVDMTTEWGNAVTPEEARSFLRAQLDQLARTAAR
jgi:hypothetical protein